MKSTAVLLLLAAIVLAGCAPQAEPPPVAPAVVNPTQATQAEVAANPDLGKSLYTTGVGASGSMVAFEQGSDKFKANPSGCALCHGADGKGVKTPKGTTPAVTYASLREAKDGKGPDFPDDEALKKAIIEGVEPDGEAFSQGMPRWKLTDAEWSALLDYLKALDKPASAAKPAAG